MTVKGRVMIPRGRPNTSQGEGTLHSTRIYRVEHLVPLVPPARVGLRIARAIMCYPYFRQSYCRYHEVFQCCIQDVLQRSLSLCLRHR